MIASLKNGMAKPDEIAGGCSLHHEVAGDQRDHDLEAMRALPEKPLWDCLVTFR